MSAPRRLLEDPETAAALRADLHTVASHQVNFDLAAGLARFEASLAAGPAVAAAGVKPSVSLLKLGAAGIVVGGAVLGVALFSGKDPSTSPARAGSAPVIAAPQIAPRAPATQPRAAAPVPVATPSGAAVEPAASATQKPARATARPTQKAAPQPAAPSAESRDDLLLREVQQLRQIRQLVGASPSQALALAN
ncbi:MAG TPA: hypothetical protein VI197_19275, partial [Polyangiaceae bacterium]